MPWLSAFRLYLKLHDGGQSRLGSGAAPVPRALANRKHSQGSHCKRHYTGSDLVIAASTLLMALALAGHRDWPVRWFRPVMALTLAIGLAYTGYSEWLNTAVRMSWAYSDLMPIVPLLQWIVIPAAALTVVERVSRHGSPRKELG